MNQSHLAVVRIEGASRITKLGDVIKSSKGGCKMKIKLSKRIISALLTLIMIAGTLPTSVPTVHAGHTCGECGEWIDGSPYCSECYACDECVELCLECGKCTGCTGSDICEGCSDDNICWDCAIDKDMHCSNCESCYGIVQGWCEECGMCANCVDIDVECSGVHGMVVCEDCALDLGSHCQGCGNCYFEAGIWCEECGLCDECSSNDEGCSSVVGAVICEECATYHGNHCPVCDQCYFDVGGWCEECGQCEDCSPACLYCCEEVGAVICTECAIDAGMHCPECSECYGECGGEYCIECGICANCADICVTEEMCIDCVISNGYHCPNCEACGDNAVICEGCSEKCNECSDAFCESCNMCDQCVLICQGCGSCEECAVICPGCEEYCSECEGICDDCELCLVCCADIAGFAGCDCGEWVCAESGDWDEHFAEEHSGAQQFGHNMRPSSAWDCDDTYHWHNCSYCNNIDHRSGTAKHTYDAKGKCTSCYYVKDAKIQIVVQPKDSKAAYVRCSDEDYDESNIAHFRVVALGNSELTYTWCRRSYVQGVMTYVPLVNPDYLEDYEGSEISVLVPEDACWSEYYICCFITDEEGNETKTVDVLLSAKHNYQYYEQWKSHQHPCEFSERLQHGHVLQCVGTECEKVTQLRIHVDEDYNGYCDVCDYEIGKIMIKKQPKDVKNVYVSSDEEDYDESNIAHFSVAAEGKSELTYTWCRKQYVGGRLTYVPLTNPEPHENYDGPNLDLLVPTDACCNEYIYACIITDEEGNETRTVDVTLKAKHNYQYYKQYLSHENPYSDARRKYHGHIAVCVGDGCGKVSRLRQHIDKNNDYFCDICDQQRDFTEINLTITVPKEGQKPNYTVGTDSDAYYAMGGTSNYDQYRFWLVSDNGVDNWKIIDKATAFVAGKYYKFIFEMQTNSKYEFPTYNSKPNFWAKVNGDYATVEKTYGKDPAKYVTVEYEFGMCNDSIIENIVIENVTTPVAGEKPTYSATVRGSGYYIDSEKNVQLDDYWNNPQQKPHYIKNGIGWFDVTESDWVYENETFVPGHQYEVCVYLKTEEGYTFYHDKWLEMLFTASVNGFSATGNTTTSSGLTEQTIRASFNCEGKKINTVMIYGLSVPRAGKTPDYTATPAYPEWYRLDPNYGGTCGIVWFDNEGNQMEPTDTFVEGKIYKAEIKIIPTQLEGTNTSQFVSPLTAYLNSKEVKANGDWDNVYVTSNAVYIYYTFPAAEAPAGCSVSGQITSFNNDSDDITVQLIPQGLPEPAYETKVKGNTANYYFENVAEGIYTLKVSKASHVTSEYTVVVGKNSVVQNAILRLKADVSADNVISAKDVSIIRGYVAGGQNIEIDINIADVTGDLLVDSKDIVFIRRYVSGGWNIVL